MLCWRPTHLAPGPPRARRSGRSRPRWRLAAAACSSPARWRQSPASSSRPSPPTRACRPACSTCSRAWARRQAHRSGATTRARRAARGRRGRLAPGAGGVCPARGLGLEAGLVVLFITVQEPGGRPLAAAAFSPNSAPNPLPPRLAAVASTPASPSWPSRAAPPPAAASRSRRPPTCGPPPVSWAARARSSSLTTRTWTRRWSGSCLARSGPTVRRGRPVGRCGARGLGIQRRRNQAGVGRGALRLTRPRRALPEARKSHHLPSPPPPPPPPTARAGQICSSTSRILVHSSVAADFYAKLKARAASIRVGDPLEPGCRLGPVVSEAQYKRVMSYVQVRARAGVGQGMRAC